MVHCNYLNEERYAASATRAAGGSITFSSVKDYCMEELNVDTYSIKYVLQGTEHYYINGQKFSVSAGKFLLVNRQQPIDVLVRSRKKTNGFCIHLKSSLLRDVYAQLFFDEASLLNNPAATPDIPLFENLLYKAEENGLGCYLQKVASQFSPASNAIDIEQAELYYHLAHHLLQTQNRFGSLGSLRTLKNSTREELLRRLKLAKEILDATIEEGINMEVLAQQCALSGAHLYRSFRKVYGVSPYQYVLQQRIKRAALLLGTNKASVTDAAVSCGFADLASFSKAFKKQYGLSPTRFLQQGG